MDIWLETLLGIVFVIPCLFIASIAWDEWTSHKIRKGDE